MTNPGPPAEVVAAIVAAVEVAWPRPAPPADEDRNASRWRFSNRWWGRTAPRSGDSGSRRGGVPQRLRP